VVVLRLLLPPLPPLPPLPASIDALTGAVSLLLQKQLQNFLGSDADSVMHLLRLVAWRDDASSLASQLVCSKTSRLLTRVVSVMLAAVQALQVRSPPQGPCLVV
jgi:hypothetical protein